MDLQLIYSDDAIAVVNKPAGMLSVPGRGEKKEDCASVRIRKLFPGCIEQPSVHRLDMDTSGLLVFALTAEHHRNLSIQFQNSVVFKKYIAVLEGIIAPGLGDAGRIELCYRLDPLNRPYQVHDPVQGKKGITDWKKISDAGGRTVVEFRPLTGRTHQLRLHAAHEVAYKEGKNSGGLGCPISGDRLYGKSSDNEHASGARLMLHATELAFGHPETGKPMRFTSAPPF